MSVGRRAYNLLRSYVGHEWERIKGVEQRSAEQELKEAIDSPSPPKAKTEQKAAAPYDEKAHAREILGVSQDANYAAIRKAFERLSKRSNPSNFPEGSIESRKAEEIHKKVHWAFSILADGVDVTERRFRSLEID